MSRILAIGGTDSSGGAGLMRDVATAMQFGMTSATVVTAVTAQSSQGVYDTHFIPADIIISQIKAVFDDGCPDAIKIGMLGCEAAVIAVSESLIGTTIPIVLDPVLRSTSGSSLLSDQGVNMMKRHLFPLATIVTPNLTEAALLTSNSECRTLDVIQAQADKIKSAGANAVLIKGGHGYGSDCTDHLFEQTRHHVFTVIRKNGSRRGTGCTLATAIACGLAQGNELPEACQMAQRFVAQWIAAA